MFQYDLGVYYGENETIFTVFFHGGDILCTC